MLPLESRPAAGNIAPPLCRTGVCSNSRPQWPRRSRLPADAEPGRLLAELQDLEAALMALGGCFDHARADVSTGAEVALPGARLLN